MMNLIEPISAEQQSEVVSKTALCIHRCEEILSRPIDSIPVLFDLSGQAAGMYIVKGRRRWIRYNPYIFAKYYNDNLKSTIPHEVAHYVTDLIYGLDRIAPHGIEWKSLMVELGADASRTTNYDLTGVPVRQYRKFEYHCSCTTHQLGVRRHHKVQRRQAEYFCRHCKAVLQEGAA